MLQRPDRLSRLWSPAPIVWECSPGLTPYLAAVERMEADVEAIAAGRSPERVWLVEHPSLYTAGTSTKEADLLIPDRLPVYRTGRGGQLTYHGPGQRVVYLMLDLKRRGSDVRAYVSALETWLIDTLAELRVRGERREGRVGVWVHSAATGRDDKIAALGIRVRHWITFHGVSLNVDPDLSHFAGIVPCGVREHGVTSLRELGVSAEIREVDALLRVTFERSFGPTLTNM
jgi:lipoyl(octanoyl) transferase